MTWRDEAKVHEYVSRVGRPSARRAGETELIEALPVDVNRVLDLGCGDGGLTAMVLGTRAEVTEAIGLDNSPPKIGLARGRFQSDRRVVVREHDQRAPIPACGAFDVVVSG